MTKTLGIRVSEDDLELFTEICTKNGTTPSDAVRAFIHQAISSGDVPKMELPDDILARIDELIGERLGVAVKDEESLDLRLRAAEFQIKCLTERLTRLETIPTPYRAELEPAMLSIARLAKHLGTTESVISQQPFRQNPDEFANWTANRDPDGVAWEWNRVERRGMRFKPRVTR